MRGSWRVREALRLTRKAAELLREAAAHHEGDWAFAGSCGHYARALEEVAACDHGQSGLSDLLRRIAGPDEVASQAAAALGHLGGSHTSTAKAKASRENGRKGGRPRRLK